MSKGYYNADNLWVAAYEQHQEEVRLNELLHDINAGMASSFAQVTREFLIEHGYNPDTGEYNE